MKRLSSMVHRLIRYSCWFQIFQIQLQGGPTVVFIGFEVIKNIHARRKVGLEMPEAEADRVIGGAKLILERYL